MAQQWKAVEGAAKNDAGEYQALVGGKWQPVAGAAKNDSGQYMALMDDAPAARPTRSLSDVATDTGIDAVRGVVGAGESVVGLADIATGNAAGKALSKIGYDPAATHKTLSAGYSDQRKAADQNVHNAKGFVETLDALIDNPSSAVGTIVQSAPLSLSGAAVVRAAATKMLAGAGIGVGTAAATEFLKRPDVALKLLAIGGAAEGAMTSGSIEEQGRQAGREYTDTVLPALAGGAITGAIGFGSSKIPGFRDAEVAAATAGMGVANKAGLIAAGKEIAKSGFKEGVLEELPQSAQEQVFTNLALGKPWNEGVGEAAAQGLIAGMGTGVGMTTYSETANRMAGAKPQSAGAALGDAIQDGVDGNQFDQRAITEDALRALSPTGKLPTPLTAKAAEASARQKSIVTGQPHQVIEHPAEAGKFTAVPAAVAQKVEQKAAAIQPEIPAEDAAMLQQAEEFGQAAAPVDHFANGVTPEALDSLFAESRAKAAAKVAEPVAPIKENTPVPVTQYDTPAVSDNLTDIIPANPIDAAAHDAATSPLNDLPEPTQAQKEAGNYKKAHIKLHGLDIAIENPKGSERSGIDPNGEAWSVALPDHYGYIKRTSGADGDHVDTYIGNNPESQHVFVVDQVNADSGKFDEHKIMLGFNSVEDAMRSYQAAFNDGRGHARIGSVTPMTMDAFKIWLKKGDTKQPVALQQFGRNENGAINVATPAGLDTPAAQSTSADATGSDANGVLRHGAATGAGRNGMPGAPAETDAAGGVVSASGNDAVAPDVTAAIRANVEKLVKRRAVAQQIKRGDYFGAALQEAKNAMAGKKVSAEKMRKHAIAFASDVKLADAFNGIADVLESSSQAKQPAQKKPQRASHDLLQRIKQLGGIDGTLALDITGEARAPGGWKFAFKKGGTGLDDLATMLADDGFMIDTSDVDGGVQQLRDMIRAHIGGERNFKAKTLEAQAEAMASERNLDALAQRANEQGINWRNLSAQQLSDAVYEAEDALEMDALDAADNPEEAAELSDAVFDGIAEDGDIEFSVSTPDEIAAWLGENDGQKGNAGSVQGVVAEGSEAGAGSNGGTNRQEAGAGQEVLQSYTAAEVAQREAAQASQERAQRAEENAVKAEQAVKDQAAVDAKKKAHADNPENFVFGESSKDANKPMGSLFNQPAQPTDEAAQSKKLEVLKAQAQGKISGDQADAMKQLADAGEHAAVDEVLKPAVDRGSVGAALTKEQKKSVLKTLVDVYKTKGAEKESKGLDRNGNERSGYAYQPELFEKSDITGAMVRYYVTLPDGRIAHPTELFPEYTQSDIDAEMSRRQNAERNARLDVQRDYARPEVQFDDKSSAEKYWDEKSEESKSRSVGGWATVHSSLDRDFLTNGEKFIMVPGGVMKNGDIVEALAAEGWKPSQPAQVEQPASGEAAPIDDFGEKIGGARKDKAAAMREAVSRELSDDDITSTPLSKIWPKDSIDQIEDAFIAAVAHAARAEVPAKPKVGYKLKAWVEKVKFMRGLVSMMLDGKVTKERFTEELKKYRNLEHFAEKVELLEQIDRASWDRIGRVEANPNAYRYEPSEFGASKQVAAPIVRVEIDGRSNYIPVSTVADAVAGVQEKLGIEVAAKKMEFEVRGQPGRYGINKKGDPLYRKLKTFETSKEALDYRDTNYADLVAAWEAVKASDNVKEDDVRGKENRPRSSEDWRKGKDVTPEQFASDLGFMAVEFGNWVGQGKSMKERQGMLNEAYDAFMDLASIIGVPPKAISLNGSLGLGFGSRGSGKASAHFEPDMLVINLTKTRGAGTLAHEWFHALDNYFQRERIANGEKSQRLEGGHSGDFITYAPENYYVNKRNGQRMAARDFNAAIDHTVEAKIGGTDAERRASRARAMIGDPTQWEKKEGVRPEVGEAFADLVKVLNESPMAKRASLIDKGKSGGYWSRIIERGARSFENYIIHKMMLNGYHNDYLANVTPASEFARDAGRYPYLLEGEIQPVAEAFDNLFATIQTKETDKGVALFSKGEQVGGQTVASVTKSTAQLRARWLGFRRVKIVQSVKEVPNEIYLRALRALKPIDQGTEGFYDPKTNTVYLIADNIASPERAAWVAIHEVVGHGGLRMLDAKVAEHIDTLAKNTTVAKLARAIAVDRGETFDHATHTEEAIAELAAAYFANGEKSLFDRYGVKATGIVQDGLRGIVQRMIDTIRRVLAVVMGKKIDAVSDADVRNVINAARQAVEGTEQADGYGEPGYALASRGKQSAESFARMALEELTSENDSVFAYKKTSSKSIDGAILDVVDGAEFMGEDTRQDERTESHADRRYVFKTLNGKPFYVYETDAGEVWIDVSRLETGSGGGAIYAAIGNYAFNTGKRFIGDPFGLSPEAVIRRTHHMLSSALRFGTTRHLDAAKQQVWGMQEDGVEPLDWRGSDIDKVEAMIHTIIETAEEIAPSIKDFHYDFQSSQFKDKTGTVVSGADIARLVQERDGGNAEDLGIGTKTARRVTVLRSLLAADSKGASGGRSGILEQLLHWSDSSIPENLEGLFSRSLGKDVLHGDRAGDAGTSSAALASSGAPLSSHTPSGTNPLNLNTTAAQPANSSIPEETEFQTRQRQVQDKMNRFKVLQAWLNHKGIKLTDKANVHEVENLMHAKIANQTQDFRDQVEAPLLERAAKAGFTLEQIADYLEAQHIPEANERMRGIHQDANATANGITDANAQATLAQFQSMPKFAEFKTLADEFRAIGDETLDMRLREGLISREQYDAYKATFKHWVPLRGDGKKPGVGKGLSVNAKEKRRLGHGERENGEYIIENLLMDRERAIYQVEHNHVVKSIIQFALEAKEPDMITVGKPEKRQVLKDQSVFEVQHKGKMMRAFSSENDAKTFINQAIALSSQNKGGGMARSNFAIAKTSDPIVVMQASPMLAENEIQGYVAGHTIRIQLNDGLLARAATNMGVDQLNMLLSAARTINNGLSKIYTAYNPDFIFRNAIRDFIAGTINLTGDMGMKMAGKIYLNYGKAAKELFVARNDPRKSAWVQKYRASGGNTGAAYLSDIERIGNDAQVAMYEHMKALDVYRRQYAKIKDKGILNEVYARASAASHAGVSKIKRIYVIGHFLTLIEHLNAVTENALRLATYMTLVQNGYTEQKAAAAAKNSTVNFNRKGEISNVAGSLFLFFNPSVQGSSRMFGSLLTSEHKGQAQAMAGMLAFASFALAELGRGGDDDDERKWKNIPDYVKDHNMILKFGDLQWTIPVPYEFAPFHVLGNAISDAVHGESVWKSALKVLKSIVDNTTPLGDPFTGDGKDGANLFQMMPTLVKMALAPHENENSFGAPIQPEKASYSKNKPDSQNMFRNTKGTLYSGVAEWMNDVSGGSKYQPGGVDVSPETLKFWVSSLTGGAGRFVTDSISAAYGATKGVAPDLRSTPIARVFVREPSVADARSRFWEAANEAKAAADAFAMAKKGHDGSAMKEIRDADNDLIQLSRFSDRMGKAAAKKRDLIDQIRMDDQIPLAQKREQMKEIEQKEQEYYDRFLKAFDQKQKARKDKAA